MSSVSELEQALNSASRQNRFRVAITIPSGVDTNTKDLQLLCTSTSVPGITRGSIEIKRDGKTVRIAGDELTDETWTVTFQVPGKEKCKLIYKAFDQWLRKGDDYESSLDYKSTSTIDQLDIDNTVSYDWKIEGIWVSALGPISFDSDASDTLQTFECTFTIDRVAPAK